MKGVMEIHNWVKFHLYSICGYKVIKLKMSSWQWIIQEIAHFWGVWALTPIYMVRSCWNLHQSYYLRRVKQCYKMFSKFHIFRSIGRSQNLHFFQFLSNFIGTNFILKKSKTKKLVWHFLFALFQFLAHLIKFRFLIFFERFGTPGNSTLGLSEAEKIAGSGEKNHPIISIGTDFMVNKKSVIWFIYRLLSNIYLYK